MSEIKVPDQRVELQSINEFLSVGTWTRTTYIDNQTRLKISFFYLFIYLCMHVFLYLFFYFLCVHDFLLIEFTFWNICVKMFLIKPTLIDTLFIYKLKIL